MSESFFFEKSELWTTICQKIKLNREHATAFRHDRWITPWGGSIRRISKNLCLQPFFFFLDITGVKIFQEFVRWSYSWILFHKFKSRWMTRLGCCSTKISLLCVSWGRHTRGGRCTNIPSGYQLLLRGNNPFDRLINHRSFTAVRYLRSRLWVQPVSSRKVMPNYVAMVTEKRHAQNLHSTRISLKARLDKSTSTNIRA